MRCSTLCHISHAVLLSCNRNEVHGKVSTYTHNYTYIGKRECEMQYPALVLHIVLPSCNSNEAHNPAIHTDILLYIYVILLYTSSAALFVIRHDKKDYVGSMPLPTLMKKKKEPLWYRIP